MRNANAPIDILFLFNPLDMAIQQCEISICIKCTVLAANRQDAYFQAFFKGTISMNFTSNILQNHQSKANIKISELSQGQLVLKNIILNKTSLITSTYPIINFDFPQGVYYSHSHRASGWLIRPAFIYQGSRKIVDSVELPSTRNTKLKVCNAHSSHSILYYCHHKGKCK